MNHYDWETTFRSLFDRCLARYRSGDADFESYYSDADLAFLRSIGCKPRELFDFVEDFADEGAPSPDAAVLIAAARRDYLLVICGGALSETEITPDQLPAKDAELEGIRWLPRIIAKANGKLRGALAPDIMYSCGGDRAFLREHDIHPADFLRTVWAADGDDAKVAAYVRDKASRGAG